MKGPDIFEHSYLSVVLMIEPGEFHVQTVEERTESLIDIIYGKNEQDCYFWNQGLPEISPPTLQLY